MSANMNEPIVVTGVYGWRDETGPTSTSYSLYGPEGRWGNDRQGHHMADALEEAGVSEGAKLVVIALPRFCDVKAEDVITHLDLLLGETEECTGLTAAWCPRCGDCDCIRSHEDPRFRADVYGDRWDGSDIALISHTCPLHNESSLHPERPTWLPR